MFTVQELSLPGVMLIKPTISSDKRGSSLLTYNAEEFAAFGITAHFVQDFMSRSLKGVVRGLHFQRAPHAQDKLVRCSYGEIFDVVADCDRASPTFGQHVAVPLHADDQMILFIPGKYAHGYAVLSDEARVEYKLSDTYHPELAGGVRFDDPKLRIDWPVKDPILSDADAKWALL